MTPGARVAAAIEILDDMNEGLAAEQALTRWARRSRFAGSKDRAAIRDHVFDVQRCRSAAAYFGQGETGRALMIGLIHAQSGDHAALFSGGGYAPSQLSTEEMAFPGPSTDTPTLWNLQPWLVEHFQDSLGDSAADTALSLQDRAKVHLRANLRRVSRDEVAKKLASEGVETTPNSLTEAALIITSGARKLRQSQSYLDGLVELQDGASQAVVAALPEGRKVLDYCAGGGGKALAISMDASRQVFAHDLDSKRMNDLQTRAERAGVEITELSHEVIGVSGEFDIVICDAPCTGSGAWRRSPDGKWQLTPERLKTLQTVQDAILIDAAELVKADGILAYATCSVLRAENEDRIAKFLANNPDWHLHFEHRFDVCDEGDGFYTAHLKRG